MEHARVNGVAPVPELLRQLDDPNRVHVAPIEQVDATGWGRGAVVPVGDAAHVMSRNLPPVLRHLALRAFGRRSFRSNYRPLLAPI